MIVLITDRIILEQIKISSNSKSHPIIDEKYMRKAITAARSALRLGDFPVGCVIEHNGKVIADGVRTSTTGKNINEIDHAEINALRKLAVINDRTYDHSKMSLYCTLEPCLMCFGAILLSGINRIVFAYEDVMGGGTSCDLSKLPVLYTNLIVNIVPGVLRNESLALFDQFFKNPSNNYWRGSKLSFHATKQINSQVDG